MAVSMNIKKYLYIGIGIFIVIVLLAVGITSEFKPSNITGNFYAFVEKFFSQWSPALAAAGTLIVAVVAFMTIYENRRSQRLATYERYFSQVEEWTENERQFLLNLHLRVASQTTKVSLHELARYAGLGGHRKALAKLAVNKLGDSALKEKLNEYTQLYLQILEAIKSKDYETIRRLSGNMPSNLDNILSTVGELRDKMVK